MKNPAKYIIEYYKNNVLIKTVDTTTRVINPDLFWNLEIKDLLEMGFILVSVGKYKFVTKCVEASGYDFSIHFLQF